MALLDGAPRTAEGLVALLADQRSGAERLVELRLGEDAVAADAAAKPSATTRYGYGLRNRRIIL
jgi:hypothetical protein